MLMGTVKRATPARATAKCPSKRRARTPLLDLTVQYAVAARGAPSGDEFREWAACALEHDAQITVHVVGFAEGRTLNRTYRGRDYATNVLTFVLNDTPPYAGDLALCAPVVAREAREQGKNVTAHYAHLTVHGVLHLQGYDHENGRAAKIMETLETRILERLGYPDPYAPLSHNG
jgi:probable rRNA maturation factor